MYHFVFVSKEESKPAKVNLIELIHELQDEVRGYFTFSYEFIGSEALNLLTYDPTTNIGFDFDVNIRVNDPNEEYSPEEIKHILMNAMNNIVRRYGYDYCEDSTRVFTIKFKD